MGIDSNAQRSSADREDLCASEKTHPGDATEGARQPMARLLGRGWSEPFALAAGFWFRFGLRRFLNFLFTFVFASHG